MVLFTTAKKARQVLETLSQANISGVYNYGVQSQVHKTREEQALQKSIPYLNILSYVLLNKGLMDLNASSKLIKNKINLYNLPDFNQFVSDRYQVKPVSDSFD